MSETIDIEKLERQIGNLRTAVVILIIVVASLFGYTVLQPYLQYVDPYSLFRFSPFFTIAIIGLGVLLLCACLSANDKR